MISLTFGHSGMKWGSAHLQGAGQPMAPRIISLTFGHSGFVQVR
jgi:hypothetical protein